MVNGVHLQRLLRENLKFLSKNLEFLEQNMEFLAIAEEIKKQCSPFCSADF